MNCASVQPSKQHTVAAQTTHASTNPPSSAPCRDINATLSQSLPISDQTEAKCESKKAQLGIGWWSETNARSIWFDDGFWDTFDGLDLIFRSEARHNALFRTVSLLVGSVAVAEFLGQAFKCGARSERG